MTSRSLPFFWELTQQVHCMGYDMVLLILFPEKHQFSFADPLCNAAAFYDWEF